MRSVRLVWMLAALLLAGLAAAPAARADSVLLGNGDRLSGELQVSELRVVTLGGVVGMAPREVWRVILGTLSGDVVQLRTGRTLTGHLDQATYTIRLPSGQPVVVERLQVEQIIFSPR